MILVIGESEEHGVGILVSLSISYDKKWRNRKGGICIQKGPTHGMALLHNNCS
jgi:hypothetical protein